MQNIEPIVYTRTYCVDYSLLAVPASLRDSVELTNLKKHLRHVMYDEDPARPLRERRWHVMRVKDRILVGIAGYEMNKLDPEAQSIRGYYGFLMPIEWANLPTLQAFHRLDDLLIAPYFNNRNMEWNRYYSELKENIIFEKSEEVTFLEKNIAFNTDETKIKFFDESYSIQSIVIAAINAAKTHEKFEFIYGLTSKEHALKLPTMNVVCFGVSNSVESVKTFELPNSSDRMFKEDISPRATTVERSPKGGMTIESTTKQNGIHKDFTHSRLGDSPKKTSHYQQSVPATHRREKIDIFVECESGMKWKIERFISEILESLMHLFPDVKYHTGKHVSEKIKTSDRAPQSPLNCGEKKSSTIDYSYGINFGNNKTVDDDENTRNL